MKKLLLVGLMMLAGSAWAEWVPVASAMDDSTKMFIDPATIRREGTLRKYWKLLDKKVLDKSGDTSSRTREELDCKQERFRITSLTTFSGSMLTGDITGNYNYPDAGWSDIPPGTMVEIVMKYVCAK